MLLYFVWSLYLFELGVSMWDGKQFKMYLWIHNCVFHNSCYLFISRFLYMQMSFWSLPCHFVPNPGRFVLWAFGTVPEIGLLRTVFHMNHCTRPTYSVQIGISLRRDTVQAHRKFNTVLMYWRRISSSVLPLLARQNSATCIYMYLLAPSLPLGIHNVLTR